MFLFWLSLALSLESGCFSESVECKGFTDTVESILQLESK